MRKTRVKAYVKRKGTHVKSHVRITSGTKRNNLYKSHIERVETPKTIRDSAKLLKDINEGKTKTQMEDKIKIISHTSLSEWADRHPDAPAAYVDWVWSHVMSQHPLRYRMSAVSSAWSRVRRYCRRHGVMMTRDIVVAALEHASRRGRVEAERSHGALITIVDVPFYGHGGISHEEKVYNVLSRQRDKYNESRVARGWPLLPALHAPTPRPIGVQRIARYSDGTERVISTSTCQSDISRLKKEDNRRSDQRTKE